MYVIFMLSAAAVGAQVPGGGRPAGGRTPGNMNFGHFYGKIVDSKTNKGISGVSVQLTGNKLDTVTKQNKEAILKTVITEANGDFSLDNLPIFGNFKLKVFAMGYKTLDRQLSFGIKLPQGGAVTPPPVTGGMQEGGGTPGGVSGIAGQADKDLGNIKLESSEADLGTVTVTSTAKPLFELGIDRKVFNVDKNLVSTGQTATEIMKSIPSLNVDIDGNVTLRNAAPTIFIDGRPTTMTLDQIPSDIIDKVEIITNPSAKYDASGGNAGILNIVLKKNKKSGYNGGLRAGIDSRGKPNLGGDFNLREGKINFFASANFNGRKSISNSVTDMTNFITPPSVVHNTADATNNGSFGFGRAGIDYLIDNRNTISVAGNYNKGNFKSTTTQSTDSSSASPSHSNSVSNSDMNFENFGGQLSFKHNFAKNGHDLTADFNYNSSNNTSNSDNSTFTYLPGTTTQKFPALLQQSANTGYNHFYTIQGDYENPISDDSKFEAGVRAAVRDFANNSNQLIFDYTQGKFAPIPSISNHYKFNDQVYAAYATYSFKIKKWSYLLGLRAESSSYTGTLLNSAGIDSSNFKTNYPLSLFPSAFITYKVDAQQDLQVNYSRRINRPGFFQLMPFPDYSNYPGSINIGNASLRPEFTNSFEVSYNNAYKRGANFLVSLYFKYTTDLLTRYTFRGIDALNPADSIYFNTYLNANSAISYGIELTNKIALTKWWDFTVNVNLYNSQINATIPGQNISNSLVSWFGKMNNSVKLGKGFSIQFSGDYNAKTVIPQSSGGGNNGRGGGGGPGGGGQFGGGIQTTAQGYILPRYGFDGAIRKDWTWKNGQSGSLTLSMNDLFRTQVYQTHSEQPGLFTQDAERRRDPQVLRLNFAYRFGKFDAQLLKRKNNKNDQNNGMDMVPSGGAAQ